MEDILIGIMLEKIKLREYLKELKSEKLF